MAKIGTLSYDINGQDNLKKILQEDKKLASDLQKTLIETNAIMGKIDLTQLRQYSSIMSKSQKDAIKLASLQQKSDDESVLRQQRLRTEIERTNAAHKRYLNTGQSGQSRLNGNIGLTNKTMFSQQNLLTQLSQAAGIYFSVYQVGSFIQSLYTISGEFEKQKVSLGAILQNTDQAGVLFERIKSLAVESPFQFSELISYTKQLSAFSIPYNELYDTTKRLADISAGLGVDMSRLVLAFGQVRSASVLRGQELRQFTEAGIPLVDELAKKFTKLTGEATTAGDVFDKISRKQVSFQMVKDIFTDLTSEGGKFYNFQAIQAETLAGKLSNLKDSYQIMLSQIGEGNSGVMKDSVELLTNMMRNWEDIARVLKTLIAIYGTYKAVLLVTNTLQQIAVTYKTVTTIYALSAALQGTTVSQMALNAAMSINPYIAAAAAIAALVGAIIYFSDETKTATDVQNEFYKRVADETQALETLKAKTESLVSVVADVTKSYSERSRALRELQTLMPSVFSNLSKEQVAAMGVAGAYREIAKGIKEMGVGTARTDYYQSTKALLQAENAVEIAKSSPGQTGQFLEDAEEKLALARRLQSLTKKTYLDLATDLKMEGNAVESTNKAWRDKVDELKKMKGVTGIDYMPDDSYADYIGKIQDEYEKLIKKNKDYVATNPFAKKEIDANKTQIASYKKVLNALGGTTEKEKEPADASTTISDRSQKIKENENAITQIITDSEVERAQLTIDAMKDGYQKESAQIQLNYDKAYAKAVDNANKVIKLAQDTEKAKWQITAKKGDKFTSKITGYSDLNTDQQTAYDSGFNIAFDTNTSDQQKLREKVLAQLSDFKSKYAKIDREYTDNVTVLSKSRTEANSEETDKAIESLKKISDKARSALKFDEFKEQVNWGEVFGDLDKVPLEKINSLREQISGFISSDSGSMEVSDIKAVVEALSKLDDISIDRDPFGELKKSMTEYTKASNKAYSAQKKLNKLLSEGKKGTDEYKNAEDKSTKAQNEKEISAVVFGKSFDKTKEKTDEFTKSLSSLGDTVSGSAGESLTLVSSIISTAMSGIGSIVDLVEISSKSMKETTTSASLAMQTLEKASVILAIISAAIQVTQKLSSLFSNSDSEYENYDAKIDEINKLTKAVNDYRIAVIDADNAENEWFSDDDLTSLKDAKKKQNEVYKAYFDQLLEQQAIYQNKSGGGWVTNFYNGVLEVYDKIYGTSVFGHNYDEGTTAAVNNLRIETRKRSKGVLGSGIGGKSQKTEDLQTWINNQAEFGGAQLFDSAGFINEELAQSLIDNYGDKLVGDTKETLEELIKLKDTYDEYIEQLKEYVSSLYEPLVTNMTDALWDWLDSGKDALSSFKDYASDTFRDIATDMMNSIILENVFGTYEDDIAKLYESFSSTQGTDADIKTLTNGVASLTSQLMDRYSDQLPALQEMMTTISDAFSDIGLDLSDSSSSASGITASAQSLTEGTGNILASYINAMRSDLSVIRSFYDGSNSGGIMNDIYSLFEGYCPTIVNILSLNNSELIKIQNNTLRSANNSDGILEAITEVRGIFKKATTSGSGTKVNIV